VCGGGRLNSNIAVERIHTTGFVSYQYGFPSFFGFHFKVREVYQISVRPSGELLRLLRDEILILLRGSQAGQTWLGLELGCCCCCCYYYYYIIIIIK
jgi:hypothetical protein